MSLLVLPSVEVLIVSFFLFFSSACFCNEGTTLGSSKDSLIRRQEKCEKQSTLNAWKCRSRPACKARLSVHSEFPVLDYFFFYLSFLFILLKADGPWALLTGRVNGMVNSSAAHSSNPKDQNIPSRGTCQALCPWAAIPGRCVWETLHTVIN